MIIDKTFYTSHIKGEENILKMRKLLDKVEILMNNHIIQYTDFLDPYERHLAKSILNRFDNLKYSEFGGFDGSEMKTIGIYPEYYKMDIIDSNISALKITGNLNDLTHRDYLGAFLGQGITRDKFGDILVNEYESYIIVKNEIKDFIIYNLETIGRNSVEVSNISFDELDIPNKKYKEIQSFLSSLRLDVYLSATYNVSRQESESIIKSGNVKVNWEPIDKASKELSIGDMVSVRGYGRSILYEVRGTSKKGRLRTLIRILV